MTSGSLECPVCGCKMGRCIDTRIITFRGVTFKRRKRVCHHCQYQFTTKEITIPDEEAPWTNQRSPDPIQPPLPQKNIEPPAPMIEEGSPETLDVIEPPPKKRGGGRPRIHPKIIDDESNRSIFPD